MDINHVLEAKPVEFNGLVNLNQNLTITPDLNVKLYGVVGPFLQPKLSEDFDLNYEISTSDWDSEITAGLDLSAGVDVAILGQIDDFSTTKKYSAQIWAAPDSLKIHSGNNQMGVRKKQLEKPLKVRVSERLGVSLADVPVYFKVLTGGGELNHSMDMTDGNGLAEVLWTLGDSEDIQKVEASYKNAAGSVVEKVIFEASEDLESFLINNSPWNLSSYVIYDFDFFEWNELGNETCYPKDVYDLQRISEGTMTFSEDRLALLSIQTELKKYNCSNGGYNSGTFNIDEVGLGWRIDEESGKMAVTGFLEEGEIFFTVTITETNVTLAGSFVDEEGIETNLIIRLKRKSNN